MIFRTTPPMKKVKNRLKKVTKHPEKAVLSKNLLSLLSNELKKEGQL